MSNPKGKNEDLEGFIDFAEVEEKNDEIEEIIDENGEKIIKIPEDEEENIYRQSEQLVRDLKSNIMEKDILYKDKAPSARHSGLRPLRIAILTLINKSSKFAEKRRVRFMGLTLYEIQKMMKPCNVSNHTIKDNLRKLVDLGLIEKKTAIIANKPQKITFYDIKLDSFPCKDGSYILWDKDFRSRGLYVIACLDGDTLIETQAGHIKIKDLKPYDFVVSLNTEGVFRQYFQNINALIKRKSDAFELILSNGAKVICSDDHPFLVWDGKELKWIELKNIDSKRHLLYVKNSCEMEENEKNTLDIQDLLSVFKDEQNSREYLEVMKLSQSGKRDSEISKKLNIRYDRVQSWTSKGYIPRGIQKINKLKQMGLFPLRYDDKKVLILSRLLGFLIGDGHLNEEWKLYSCGQRFENESIASDLDLLGIKYRFNTQDYLIIDDRTISSFFKALGMVDGARYLKHFEIPKWIKFGTKEVKREFISGIFGAESDTPHFQKNQKKLFSIRLGMRKWIKFEQSLKTFFVDIQNILSEFGIESIVQRKKKIVNRKDGKQTVRYDLYINNFDNILHFLSLFDFAYSIKKHREGERVQAYLNYHKLSTDLYNQEVKEKMEIAEMMRDNGNTYQEISGKVDMPYMTLYDRMNKTKNPYKTSEIPYYDDIREKIPVGDYVKTASVESVTYIGERELYDITTDANENGNFFANGILTHNCPKYPFCSLKKEDCRILDHLVKLLDVLPKHIRAHGVEVEDVEMNFPNQIDVEEEVEQRVVVLPKKKEARFNYEDLGNEEKETIKQDILELRNSENESKSLKECVECILNKYEVGISVEVVYDILKGVQDEVEEEKKSEEVVIKEEEQLVTPELQSFRELSQSRKKEVEATVLSIIKGELPKTWSECIEIIKEELGVIINEYNISRIMNS